MKKILLNTTIALTLACPVYAQTNANNLDDQKTNIQNQYKSQRDAENDNYKSQIANVNSQYHGDQLTAVKKQLELEHTKKLQDLASDEKISLQKLDAQKHNVQ